MSKHRHQNVISPALSRLVMWILVLSVAFVTLEHIKTTLTVFTLAFVIAYLLNSVVTLLETKYHMKRKGAIVVVYAALFATVALVAALLMPLVVNQVNGMVAQVPSLPSRFTNLATQLREEYLSRLPAEYQDQVKETVAKHASTAAEMATSFFIHLRDFVLGLISAAFLIFTSLIVSIFAMLSWHELGENFLDLLPDSYRQEITTLGHDLHRIFGGYLRAQITLASCCGALTLVLLILHSLVMGSNPYLLVISCIAMLTFPIPLVNQVVPPISAAILGFINADSGVYAGSLAVTVYAANFVIERTMAPRIMSEAVGVSPLFVLFGAFSGAELLGPVGALLGVPLAAMIKSIFVWFHGRFLKAREDEEEGVAETSVEESLRLHSTVEHLRHEVERLKASLEEHLHAPVAAKPIPAESPKPSPETPKPSPEAPKPSPEAARPSPEDPKAPGKGGRKSASDKTESPADGPAQASADSDA